MNLKTLQNITLHNRITINSEIMLGKPTVAGTRITVDLILRQLAQGLSIENILENYPHLKKEDIYAAIEYAADLTEEENIYPLLPSYEKIKAFA